MDILCTRMYVCVMYVCMYVCINVKYVYIPHAYYISTIALTEKQLLYICGQANSPNRIYHYTYILYMIEYYIFTQFESSSM